MRNTLTIKYIFNPRWDYVKTLFTSTKYNIIEYSQICPICENNKNIGNVVIYATLWKSNIENINYLFYSRHTYIFEDGIMNVDYTLSNIHTVPIFPTNSTLITTIAPGGSGKYALSRGNAVLKTDETNVRTVTFNYKN